MMQEFRGKVSVITGAGSGIGRGLATLIADAGGRLAISDIDQAGLEETGNSRPDPVIPSASRPANLPIGRIVSRCCFRSL